MDKVDERCRAQLFVREAEDRVPRRVEAHEVSVECGDRKQVERQSKEAIEILSTDSRPM
jgi:hypothetical protein